MAWPSKIRNDPPRYARNVRFPPDTLKEVASLAEENRLSINSMILALVDAGIIMHGLPNGKRLIVERLEMRRARTEKPRKEKTR